MNRPQLPPSGSIKLPHGAWLTKESNLIHIPTGKVLLKFALSEIDEFANIIDDIVTVLGSNLVVNVHTCESCGHQVEEIDYNEPEGEDLA